MPKNTQIVLFSNIAVLVFLQVFYLAIEQNLLIYPPVGCLFFNIVAGLVIFFINRELSKAFLLLGLTLLLIGGSVCGLGMMFWKITH